MRIVRRNKMLHVLLAICLTLPFLTGCWDRLEIEERAVVLGVAVDLDEATAQQEESEVSHIKDIFPKPQRGKIRVTAQIAVPGRIPLGPGEGSGGGSGQKPVWVLSAVGYTMDDAMMVLQQELADRIFLGHLRIIVVGEALARQGMGNLNDYLRRNSEVRRLAWMVVSKGKAAELIGASPELERVPALYLLSMMDHAVEMGKYPNEFLGIFWSKASSKGREAHLPYVEIKKAENVEIAGLAYFKEDQMVGVTTPLEIDFFMGITGFKTGGYTIYIPLHDNTRTVMYRSSSRSQKTDVVLKDGKPHFRINVQLEGNVEEKSDEHTVNMDDHETLLEIEKEIVRRSEEGFRQLIEKTQQAGSDIFGYGEYVRAKEANFWNREIKTKEAWQEMYKDITFEIHINAKIRRVGMKSK